MNKLFRLLALAVVLMTPLALTACSKVEAGNVGVKVYLLGAEKGVDNEILGPGRYWIGWNEDLYLFPTFAQTKTFDGENQMSFQTRDGMVVSSDVGVTYAIDADKVASIFQKYRKGVDEITDLVLRNMIRDAFNIEASTRSIESVYGGGKAALIADVEKRVRDQVGPTGIKIERIYFTGELVLPQQVTDRINATIEAQQRTEQIKNEVFQREAEAQKAIADAKGTAESIRLVAQANAEANKLLNESLTPSLVQYKAIEKWTGDMPRVTGGALPFLDVGALATAPQQPAQ